MRGATNLCAYLTMVRSGWHAAQRARRPPPSPAAPCGLATTASNPSPAAAARRMDCHATCVARQQEYETSTKSCPAFLVHAQDMEFVRPGFELGYKAAGKCRSRVLCGRRVGRPYTRTFHVVLVALGMFGRHRSMRRVASSSNRLC